MNIFLRLIVALGGVALITALVISLVFTSFMNRITSESQVRQLANLFDVLEYRLEQEGDSSLALANLVAKAPLTGRAMAEQDREALLDHYGPAFQSLHDEHGVRQFQFHLPPATSFLRVHKPETFGDDLSAFRATVVEANTRRASIRGLEHGVAGLGMRGVMPVSHEGIHVGTVEFGLSFDQSFFQAFDDDNDVRVALYLPAANGTFEAFANTGDTVLIGTDAMESVMQGDTVIETVRLDDLAMAVMAEPVVDFSGRTIGVATIALDIAPYLARMDTARWLAVGATAGTLILALVIGSWIAISISSPVRQVTETLRRLAARDFSTSIPEAKGKWEIPRMLRSMREFSDVAAGLHETEQTLKTELAEVQVRQKTLATAARANLRGVVAAAVQANEAIVIMAHVTRNVNAANVQSQAMASAVEEMVASTQEISASSDHAAHEAEDTRGTADQGVSGAGAAVNTMEGIHNAVRDAADRVDTLAQASAQIGEIVQQIEDIADQTNLLALNATIEAARAGDAGKGFAVVANEVKSLASQTARATEDIRNRIDTLRGEMDSIVSAMEKGAKAVEEGRGVVTNLGGHLGSIADGIGSVTDRMRDIASILTQQTQAANEIAQGTSAIADLARRNNDELQQSLQSMDNATGTLNEQVARISKTGGSMVLVEVAKNDHVVFKKRIVDAVIGRDTWREHDIPDHHSCRLGKWVKGVTDPTIRNHAAFKALDKPHADVHRLGVQAVRAAAMDDLDSAMEAVDGLHRASAEVVKLLSELSIAVEKVEGLEVTG
ncbi:methyl-accepting chemotaxis protein [Roseospira visakhapatnamensis]|uniref:Methyl-accepting chemotaxis protein n=1 Tax=Roseospira visakhapatnamensis TaxID=390880 RepID=A0A7W6W9B6_9PROT|nr:methyl-accepting chemotaxis protein [Roseospira visakhapatnamensis]MBB4265699.1 methyl-accepting chemotaxis protein [Roseospira visakhapatnamensis]